jgi:hypothetical protein
LQSPLSYGWLLLGAVNCTAMIDGTPAGGSSSQGSSSGTPGSSTPGSTTPGSTTPGGGTTTLQSFTCAAGATPDPGPSPLSLLSRTQYLNTLHGLFTSLPDLTMALGTDTNYSTTFGAGQADIDQVQLGPRAVRSRHRQTPVRPDLPAEFRRARLPRANH